MQIPGQTSQQDRQGQRRPGGLTSKQTEQDSRSEALHTLGPVTVHAGHCSARCECMWEHSHAPACYGGKQEPTAWCD